MNWMDAPVPWYNQGMGRFGGESRNGPTNAIWLQLMERLR
jgi:hypothetical protein